MTLVDTSVVLDSPEILLDQDTWLVRETLDELDRLKTHSGTKGYLARHAIRYIYDIKFNRFVNTPSNVKGESVDKVFIAIAGNKANSFNISNIKLKDFNLANYLRLEGIEVEVIETKKDIPEAYFFENLPNEQVQEILNSDFTTIKHTRPNQYGIINPEQGSILAFSKEGKVRKIRERALHISNSACVNARNKEQIFLMDSLLNTDIPLIMVSGPAGTGKTLMTVACGLHSVLRGDYKKLLILTPPVHVGNKDKLGFFPGNKDDKLRNYFGGARDALEYLLGDRWDRDYADFIDFESTTLTRGRSYRNAFIMLDEGQNTTPEEMLTLVTRVGEDSKLVVAGDPEQSDISHSLCNTGLGAVITAMVVDSRRFRGEIRTGDYYISFKDPIIGEKLQQYYNKSVYIEGEFQLTTFKKKGLILVGINNIRELLDRIEVNELQYKDKVYVFTKPLGITTSKLEDGTYEVAAPEIKVRGYGKHFEDALLDLKEIFANAYYLIKYSGEPISRESRSIVEFINKHCCEVKPFGC